MTLNFGRGLSKDRNAAANEAMVLSVDADSAPDTLRVSLQWQGDHDIADFDLQRFGKVLQIQDETGERQKVGGQAALRSGSCVCGCDLNFGYQRRNRG
jgi:hypothetical protein